MDEIACGLMGLPVGVVLGIDVLDESGLVQFSERRIRRLMAEWDKYILAEKRRVWTG